MGKSINYYYYYYFMGFFDGWLKQSVPQNKTEIETQIDGVTPTENTTKSAVEEPKDFPTTTKVFKQPFEDVVKGYLKFALKPESDATSSVVTITKDADSVTYSRVKSKTISIPWIIMKTFDTTNIVKFKQVYTIYPGERKMTVFIHHLSHTDFGSMSESEVYYAVGDQTHLTRHGKFGFSGSSSWFGMKSSLENMAINKFLAEAERHDSRMEQYIKLAHADKTYDWSDIANGTWNPHY